MINETTILETDAVFSEDMSKRFELTKRFKGEKGKTILVIMLNPAAGNIKRTDTTTNLLMNHLCSDNEMGYTTITIWNLFADICNKLKPIKDYNNSENMMYLEKLLERNFDNILIGYGNTFEGNKVVQKEKAALNRILEQYQDKVVHIIDEKGELRCRPMHPLFAGQRISRWRLAPYKLLDIVKELGHDPQNIEKGAEDTQAMKKELAINNMKKKVQQKE